MSAPEVCEKCVERIESGAYDVIILNFANCDMVGHTGITSSIVGAMSASFPSLRSSDPAPQRIKGTGFVVSALYIALRRFHSGIQEADQLLPPRALFRREG